MVMVAVVAGGAERWAWRRGSWEEASCRGWDGRVPLKSSGGGGGVRDGGAWGGAAPPRGLGSSPPSAHLPCRPPPGSVLTSSPDSPRR